MLPWFLRWARFWLTKLRFYCRKVKREVPFAVNFKIFSNIYEIFSLRSLEIEVLDYDYLRVLHFISESTLAGEGLNFLIQLEAIVTGTGTEHATAAYEHGRVDVTDTCTAATLLLVELAGRAGYFATFLGLVCALTLVGEVLLHIEINGMLVGIDCEHLVGELGLAAGILTFDIVDYDFHYFSIKTIEPLLPGIEPLMREHVVLGKHFNDTEVLDGNLFVAHLAGHTHALEYLCGVRAGTYRTGCAEAVVLTVG